MSQASSDQRQMVEKRWSEIRADIQSRWPQITDDELQMIGGDSRKLVALVHQRTNAPISDIEDAIDEIAARSGGLLARLSRTASDWARQANRTVSAPLSGAMQQAQHSVSNQPTLWLTGGFMAGMLVGIALARSLRAPEPSHRWWS